MDIVLVTFNSEKWIVDCVDSIEKANRDGLELNLYIVDNQSTDETINILQQLKKKTSLQCFQIEHQKENGGFGKANNIGASKGNSEIICFLNVDTTVYYDTFSQLKKEIEYSEKKVAAWEMQQLPYEHPKIYNPVNRETTWLSGSAFAVRRNVFNEIGGFEEKLFMYAEDVDLSWRIRSLGYTIQYCPKVKINHYAYQKKQEVKPTQYVYSLCNNLLLRYRFGTIQDIIKGHVQFWIVLFFHKEPFLGAKKELLKVYNKHWKKASFFWKTRNKNEKVAKFMGWDYEIIRDGAFYQNNIESIDFPKVSIIVRTCQRPQVLRETLCSIRNQIYPNIETVIVEDGSAISKKMIMNEFRDMNIIYEATGEKKGRSYAGNRALELSTGKYINFLDDDDLFFADHVYLLVTQLEKSQKLAAYSFGFETPVVVNSIEPYKYEVKAYNKRYTTKFDEVELCYHNYIPIQCIMFSRELYEKFGGFDTSLDYLEDWDLWVRYAQKGEFLCVEKTTSLYKVPFEQKIQKQRQKKLDEALVVLRKKHESYKIPVNASKLAIYRKKKRWER